MWVLGGWSGQNEIGRCRRGGGGNSNPKAEQASQIPYIMHPKQVKSPTSCTPSKSNPLHHAPQASQTPYIIHPKQVRPLHHTPQASQTPYIIHPKQVRPPTLRPSLWACGTATPPPSATLLPSPLIPLQEGGLAPRPPPPLAAPLLHLGQELELRCERLAMEGKVRKGGGVVMEGKVTRGGVAIDCKVMRRRGLAMEGN